MPPAQHALRLQSANTGKAATHLLALPAGAGASSMSSVGLTVGCMGLWLGEALRGDGPVIGWFTRWPCASALDRSSHL